MAKDRDQASSAVSVLISVTSSASRVDTLKKPGPDEKLPQHVLGKIRNAWLERGIQSTAGSAGTLRTTAKEKERARDKEA